MFVRTAPPETRPAPRTELLVLALLAGVGGWGASGCDPSRPSPVPADPCLDAVVSSPCQEARVSASGASCELVFRPFGAACDDGDPCTTATACNTLAMCVGMATECDDGDPCTTDSCVPGAGCSHALEDGLPCSDGDPCTQGDACDLAAGTCVGGEDLCAACDVAAPDDCDASFTPDNLCDGTVTCQEGRCALDDGSVPSPCDTSRDNDCRKTGCVPATGACAAVLLPPGTACDDGNPCTFEDACDGSGECVSGPPVTCDDGDDCTDDVCDASLLLRGCVNFTTCPCEQDSDCAQPPFGCLRSVCHDTVCEFEVIADGPRECDNDACTTGDTCGSGICSPGGHVDCPDDGDPCTLAACSPDTGACSSSALAGGPCDDGDPCTDADACVPTGACIGLAVECDDGVDCTTDTCTADIGCTHAPNDGACATAGECLSATCDATAGCLQTPKEGACEDDGDPCTIGGTCVEGACQGGSPKPCDDSDACTADTCDPATGDCVATPQPGLGCDDSNACTQADVCSAEGLCAGTPLSCDDGIPCTVDACDPLTGCSWTPVDSTCPDSADCLKGLCDPATGCTVAPADGAPCQPADPCLVAGTCAAGVCGGATPNPCDDGDHCTTTTCTEGLGCDFAPVCDDGDVCTDDACDAATGACTNEPTDCDDGDPCTSDGCEASLGCQHEGLCTDGLACTEDSCDPAGQCTFEPLSCDDGDQCTADVCSEPEGCVHQPLSNTPCEDGSECTGGDHCQEGECVGGEEWGCETNNHCAADGCENESSCYQLLLKNPCHSFEAPVCGEYSDTCSNGVCYSGLNDISVGAHNVCLGCWVGGVRCWGDPSYGLLGAAGSVALGAPLQTDVADARVSAGDGFVCTSGPSGDGARCWGRNDLGQLGTLGVPQTAAPHGPVDIEVVPGAPLGNTSPVLRGATACSLKGGLRCWGDNTFGQAQPGGPPILTAPATVNDQPSPPFSVCVGVAHACSSRGCWGSEAVVDGAASGALGDGAGQTLDGFGVSFQTDLVACGDYHACSYDPTSGLRCWGANGSGQAGQDPSVATVVHVPNSVPSTLGSIAVIAAGRAHTCVLSNCEVYCWGDNQHGQLGTQSSSSSHTPVLFELPDTVPAGVTATDVAAGGDITCLALTNGGVVCAGDDSEGLLAPGPSTEGVVYTPPEFLCGDLAGLPEL